MILFFDTETTGLVNKNLPMDHQEQPRLVQIAMQLTTTDGEPISSASLIVNPGVKIPEAATAVHGVSDEMAERAGVKEETALGLYYFMADRAKLVVAHNIAFDLSVINCLAARKMNVKSNGAPGIFCTMKTAAPIVNLPPTERMVAAGIDKPKPPKLEECISHFFGETLEGAHDALVDVKACARVFFHLQTLGVTP